MEGASFALQDVLNPSRLDMGREGVQHSALLSDGVELVSRELLTVQTLALFQSELPLAEHSRSEKSQLLLTEQLHSSTLTGVSFMDYDQALEAFY